VREALIEREILLNAAPHIIWPMRFVLPHNPSDRPAWFIRLGLFLYDHLGGRKKLHPRTLDLLRDPEGAPILDSFHKGFEYSDCWVDDAPGHPECRGRRRAQRHILTRTRCVAAERKAGAWEITLQNTQTGEQHRVRAKALSECLRPVGAGHHQ
jgi:glycerol-3-phosphate dehydrogenase